jgi:hypothetical protein
MPEVAESRTEPRIAAGVGLTVRGTITTAGHSIPHVQYLTDSFVVTELGRSTIVHSTALGGRFVVDRALRRLKRVDPLAQNVQVEHLRELVGAIAVHRDPELVEVDGFPCRRYRLCNDSTRLVVSAEAYCTRLPEIAATALHDERQVEAQLHPFVLPLEPDELVVRSTTQTFANGFQHTQSYRLGSLERGIADLEALEALLAFPIDED